MPTTTKTPCVALELYRGPGGREDRASHRRRRQGADTITPMGMGTGKLVLFSYMRTLLRELTP